MTAALADLAQSALPSPDLTDAVQTVGRTLESLRRTLPRATPVVEPGARTALAVASSLSLPRLFPPEVTVLPAPAPLLSLPLFTGTPGATPVGLPGSARGGATGPAASPDPRTGAAAASPDQRTEDAGAQRETAPQAPARARPLVHLADADSRYRGALASALARRGFEVAELGEGSELVRRALAEMPDLIVLDTGLPGVNGFDALDLLQRSRPGQPFAIVFLTDFENPGVARVCRQWGALDYLRKHPEPEAAAEPLARLLADPGALRGRRAALALALLRAHRASGRLEVAACGVEGEVLLRGGSVVEARWGSLSGAEALTALSAGPRDAAFGFEPEPAAAPDQPEPAAAPDRPARRPTVNPGVTDGARAGARQPATSRPRH